MKNLFIFSKNAISSLLCLIIFIINSSNAQSKQEESIMKVLRTENEAFFNRDTVKLKSVWLRNDDIQRIFVSKWRLLDMRGWDKMKASIEKVSTHDDEKMPITIKYENIKTQIVGNLAFVEFDRIIPPFVDERNLNSHDFGVLVNEKNQWKLSKMITIYTETYQKNLEDHLNDTGYQFLWVNKTPEALELFKINVRLNPNSWNVYDSLGEAYALAGDKKLAIENYEKSLALKPDNKNGQRALDKLKITIK